MRTLFLTTAALAALVMIAPVGNAHAEFIHGYVNGQYVSGHVHTGPQGFGAGFAEGLANAAALGGSTAPPPGARYWQDLVGGHHDCSEWHFPWTTFNNCR
jgi:hypothetical protein